jgi:diaminopimelate decarboxylase
VDPTPYQRALEEVLKIVDQLSEEGIPLEFLDLGGGYGVGYGVDEPEMLLAELASVVVPALSRRDLRLILEPGRYIVGEGGLLLTRVLYLKRSGGKTFVITDGGMTELLRPSHYGGYHRIEPVSLQRSQEEPVDVVGPICETGDFLARDRILAVPNPGDLLAVRTAGAYGFAMALNYNGRLRPAEVMVEEGEALLIRERETLEDLVRGQPIPPPSGSSEGEAGRPLRASNDSTSRTRGT